MVSDPVDFIQSLKGIYDYLSGDDSYDEEVKNLLFGELDHAIEKATSYQQVGKQVRLCLLP